jgi:hypothetical protein
MAGSVAVKGGRELQVVDPVGCSCDGKSGRVPNTSCGSSDRPHGDEPAAGGRVGDLQAELV